MKMKLSYSSRKYIRREKARIRREFSDIVEREERIEHLYEKVVHPKNEKP